MSESTVAIRYAKSLIDLAKDKKVVDEVFQDMMFFKRTADENRGLMLALKSPVVRHEKKLAILEGIFKSRVNPITFSIFHIITRKNREGIIYAIANEYIKLYDESKGILTAHITSAVALNEDLRKRFIDIVAEDTGKTVQLEEKVDDKLIGGYVLRVGDRQVDASIRKQLNNLKLELVN